MDNYQQPYGQRQNEWYRPVNPNEHIYTPGYGFYPRQPWLMEQDLIKRYCGIMVAAIICFFLICPFISQICASFILSFLPDISTDTLTPIAYFFGVTGSLILPFWIAASSVKIPTDCALPFKAVPVKLVLSALGVCLGVSVVGIYANMALDNLLYAIGLDFYPAMEVWPENPLALTFYMINSTAIPAVLEEAAFRGVVMQSLRRFGDSFALLASSVLFALAHPNPISMPNAFLLGLVIGYFVLFTGSLHTGMIMHFVNNVLAILVSQLGKPDGIFSQLDHGIGQIVFLGLEIFYLIMAAFSIIWLLTHYENIFALSRSNTINRAGVKVRCFFFSAPFVVFLIAVALRVCTLQL